MDDILKKESMGGGDVKLLFLVGLYLGLYKTMLCLILSCVLGLIFIGIKNNKETQEIPFCPAISLATYFCLLFGSSVISWYFGLFF